MKQHIGILGSGAVGLTLARGLQDEGHEITIGSRTGKSVVGWDGAVATFAVTAAEADLVVLAVKGSVAGAVVKGAAAGLAGKTVIDATNPIDDTPPQDGVLHYFTELNQSLMEQLQAAVPDAHFVKAFNSVGSALMVHPRFTAGRPTMFMCGDHAGAKAEAAAIIDQLGWEPADMGTAAAARAIEPLCMLWCIPGLRDNHWTHAFKLLKA